MSLDLGTLTGYLELKDGQFDSTIEKLPEKLKGSGALMTVAAGAVAVGIGAALSNGLENAIDLDDAKHKITAQLGLSAEESARIGGVAGKLYAQAYGESVEDVNTAVQNVVSSIDGMRGATSDALEAMTAKALNFGSAFEIDTARSTQVVGQLIKTGLVKDATEGFDLLTAAMQKVPANVREDILDAADEYGPFFQQMGIDGAQAMQMLVDGSAKGMYGIDKLGDAVKEFSIRATDLGDTGAQQALSDLGLTGTDVANDLLAGGERASDAFNTVVTALQRIPDAGQQAKIAGALFGTQIEDLNKGELPAFLDNLHGTTNAMGDFEGSADRMGQALNGSAKVGWEQLSRTWDSIIGQVGGALLPVLSAVIDYLNQNPAVLSAVAIGLGILAAAFVAVTVAQWAMNAAMLASPLTWIILGIMLLIAAVVALVMNWDTVVAWITDVWNGFIGWITDVIDGFVSWWSGVWEGFAGWTGDVWEGFVSWITGVWQGFIGWITDVINGFVSWWNNLWSGVGGFFTDLWNGLVLGVTVIWQGFVSWIMSMVIGYVSWWYGIWNGVAGFFGNLWGGIVGGATAAWNGLLGWLGGIPGAIMGLFAGAGDWLWNAGQWILDGLLGGLQSAWSSVTDFIGGIGDWIAANKGPEDYDRRLLVRHGGWIMSGLSNGLADGFVDVQGQVASMAGEIEASFGSPDLTAQVGALGGTGSSSPVSGAQGASGSMSPEEAARWEELSARLEDLADAVRSARPIEVHSNDPDEVATVVAEHLR